MRSLANIKAITNILRPHFKLNNSYSIINKKKLRCYQQGLVSKHNVSSCLIRRHYSTDIIHSANETTIVLNVINFTSWTKDEVYSLLCSNTIDEGQGFTPEKVQPLYNIGFDGIDIAIIVMMIQEKGKHFAFNRMCADLDYKHISKVLLQNVLRWAQKLLDTKLYHLWSEEQLCKPTVDGGFGLTQEQAIKLIKERMVPDAISHLMEIKMKDMFFTPSFTSNRDIKTDLIYDVNNPFVDRHDELLQILNHAFTRMQMEKPVLVYSISAPGMGKSTLLVEWINQLTNHQKKVVIYRFLNGQGKNDNELCIEWYDKLMKGELPLNNQEKEKVQFLNSLYRCSDVGDFIGVNFSRQLKRLRRQFKSIDCMEFGRIALATILKIGIARKYQGRTIYNKQRFTFAKNITEETTDLPIFLHQNNLFSLLEILKDLSDQNPITKTELPFKHSMYGIAEKHFLYIALDEIQEISGESEKDGAYYMLSAILDIWDNPYYNVFVLSAGLSTNHSFPESKAIEYNYPPTPLLEMKHLNKILKEKYAKQLFHNSKKSNRKNMLNTEISERLKIAFFKCGGNARYVNEIVRIFEPLINGTRTLKLQEVALQSEGAIKSFASCVLETLTVCQIFRKVS